MLNGNYGGTPTEAHQHSLLAGIKAAVPGAKIIYDKACELNDEYSTIHHLQDFNDGKGVKVEFWNNRELEGEPAKTDYYNELNFSTFGAWGFAQGVSRDSLSVRISGTYKSTFTGEMKYTLTTDNGYTLKVNGEVVEEAKAGGRRGFGFGFGRKPEYKSFPVEAGKTYDVVIETNNYIDKIRVNTSMSDYLKNFVLGSGYSISVDNGNSEFIYTGSKTRISHNGNLVVEFSNIVRGDINGDGKISSLDYVKVKNHIMNTKRISGIIFELAADANEDNKISSLDYVRIKNIIMNGGV